MTKDKHSKSVASSSTRESDDATFSTTKKPSVSDMPSTYEDILLSVREKLANWTKWKKQLKSRKKLTPLRKLLGINCLLWALPTSDAIYCSTIARLVQLKNSSKEDDEFNWAAAAEEWMTASKEKVTLPLATEAIAWAHALPTLASRLDEDTWLNLLASLLYLAQPSHQRPVENELVRILLTTELAMGLAYNLPEIPDCKKRFQIAAKHFESTMDSMFDGEGMPHAKHLNTMHLLLATSTRTLMVDEELKKRRIGKNARLQFDWLCRQTLRWSRPNGSQIFDELKEDATTPSSPHFDDMMKSALQLTGDDSDVIAYKLLRGKRKTDNGDAPEPAEHSEWSCLATMRSTWLPNAARLAVSYTDRKLTTEFAIGSQVIFSGPHNPFVTIDGEELTAASDWEEVCWETDEDMDFVELDMRLSQGWRIQRQLLLAREDSFALISDSLIGPATADIRYRSRLPLAPGISLEQPEENTEAYILGEKRLGTIIPLSLPEWKAGNSTHRFRLDPAGLEIQQRGRGLYAPLFIDFDPTRKAKALTWRSLTIAESLNPVASDVAAAFRIQIGKEQWAIYRSIAKPGNRTFLGQNLTCEFLVGQFDTDGEVEPIVEVST